MNALRKLRKERNVTQKQLARALGVSESTISLYESGKHEPDHATLIKIADYFNVSIDYLLGRTSNPSFYVHKGISVGDGREAIMYSTQKDLSPEQREQAERDLQYALKSGPTINLRDSSLSSDELVKLIRQIVDQALSQQARQDDH